MPESAILPRRFASPRNAGFAALCFAFLMPVAALAQNQIVPPGPPGADPTPTDFSDLAERLSTAVVNISTSQTLQRNTDRERAIPNLPEDSPLQDFFNDFLNRDNGRPRRVTSLGSGFIIDAEGYVVTNNHVIEDADQIEVTLSDGVTTFPADLVGTDEKTDLALLKMELDGEVLPVAVFGNSDEARVGQWVLAIGNPFGLGGSVTAGIISARNRYIDAGEYDDFIQTDAAINQGNSGGPLFNMAGEVIGINTAIYSTSGGGSVGIGFSIPSNEARHVVEQLRATGQVSRGMIGVRIQAVSADIAAGLDLESARGALVSGVTEGGAAASAGIQEGDVIIRFDGQDIADDRALPRIVAQTEPGRSVDVEIIRRGQRRTLQVSVAQLPDDSLAQDEDETATPDDNGEDSARLGLTLEPLTGDSRFRFQIENTVNGVLVVDVDISGPAGDKLRPGDVIMEVAQQRVNTPDDVEARVTAELEAGRSAVLLRINRGGTESYVGIRIRGR
jgi:serine protease Do